jgi:hypothetical protein
MTMEEGLNVIPYTNASTSAVVIAHYHPPSTKLPTEWTDAFGVRVEAPADLSEWIAGE